MQTTNLEFLNATCLNQKGVIHCKFLHDHFRNGHDHFAKSWQSNSFLKHIIYFYDLLWKWFGWLEEIQLELMLSYQIEHYTLSFQALPGDRLHVTIEYNAVILQKLTKEDFFSSKCTCIYENIDLYESQIIFSIFLMII